MLGDMAHTFEPGAVPAGPRPALRLLRHAITAALAAVTLVVVPAAPAFAHGTAQVPATDYAVRIAAVQPTVPGLSVKVVDNGARLELRNPTATMVTVLGYDNEPYLRVSAAGVFENIHSPAVFWNRQAAITSAPPASQYNAKATPVWHRISTGDLARWHDHRAHYVGARPKGAERVVLRDRVPFEVTAGTTTSHGAIQIVVDYVPAPSPLPPLLLALFVALVLIGAGRTKAWPRALAASLVMLVVTATAQLIGEWDAVTLSLPSRIGEHVYVFAGVALGIAAVVWIVVRRAAPYDATPIALLAGVALLLASGLAGLPLLVASQLPTSYSLGVERVLVAATIGSGVATVVTAATRLRKPFQARPRHDSPSANEILRSMYAEK